MITTVAVACGFDLASDWLDRCAKGSSRQTGCLLLKVAAAIFNSGIGLFYWTTRQEAWSWILQDFLCAVLGIAIIKYVKVPTLKIAFILLLGLAIYDLFWVFVSPFFVQLFSGHNSTDKAGEASGLRLLSEELQQEPGNSVVPDTSVMVSVADASKNGEVLPITFSLPAAAGGQRILGLGDVLIPGLSCALFKRFDAAASLTLVRTYFAFNISAAV